MSVPTTSHLFPTPIVSTELNPHSVHLLVENLLSAGQGTVHVLKAPPGMGKSTLLQQDLAERWHRTPGLRILWATHGTHANDSLGAEAEEKFREGHKVTVRRLYGRDYTEEHGWPTGAYKAQFEWSPDPLTGRCEIKIISHAHLRSVFARNAASVAEPLRGAHLLVIDEDPASSLILSYPTDDQQKLDSRHLNWGNLNSTCSRGVLSEALLTVMNRALASDLGSLRVLETNNPITGREWRSFTGSGFLTALREAVGSGVPDWAEFSKLLPVRNERWVTTVLQQEYASGRGSQRFGVTWDARDRRTMTFRYDVRQPLELTMPTLILDAYADEELYRALFAEQQVEVLTLGTPQPLEIEVAPQARKAQDTTPPDDLSAAPSLWLDRTNISSRKSKSFALTDYVLQEVMQGTLERKGGAALLLGYKSMKEPLLERLPAVYASHGRQFQGMEQVDFQHWYAGRGVNRWEGRNVYAVNKPVKPLAFEHHMLAALFPNDALKRHEKARFLEMTEVLQMLHRGRQTRYRGTEKPRVVTAFRVLDLITAGYAVARPYQPYGRYTPGSSNPNWVNAVTMVSSELIQVLGAVPTVALMVLGLLKWPENYLKIGMAEHASVALKVRVRSRKSTPHLMAWKGDPEALKTRFPGLKPRPVADTYDELEQLLLDSLPTLKKTRPALQKLGLPVSPDRSKLVVFAEDESRATEAIRRLLGER